MNSFEEQLQRLKEALGLSQDQEVAAALGLTKASFSDRKRRGSFPEAKVVGLKAQVPSLDVAYVLTGRRIEGTASRYMDHAASFSAMHGDDVQEAYVRSVKSVLKDEDARGPLTRTLVDLLPWCSNADIELLVKLAARLGGSASRRVPPPEENHEARDGGGAPTDTDRSDLRASKRQPRGGGSKV